MFYVLSYVQPNYSLNVLNWCPLVLTFPTASLYCHLLDVDGRHVLPGASEVASPDVQRDSDLLCLLSLQSHHCEAADVTQCGPGKVISIPGWY